ncbi:unnamed protein product [Cuscuta campestris]|uniref:Uncharacterized protein n=1 Tax=Cuscuta campestris TaxID=132261 RepID=A0A484N1K2_9ASTE|nr:unnamed protein product [Cuscuta campestris]
MDDSELQQINNKVSRLNILEDEEGISLAPNLVAESQFDVVRTWVMAGRLLPEKVVKFDVMKQVLLPSGSLRLECASLKRRHAGRDLDQEDRPGGH